VGLLASSLVFLALFLGLYRTELAAERSAAAAQVNQLLQTSLENAMLKRDLDGLRVIVERLGQQPGIEAVFITDPRGAIRFASDPALLNAMQPPGPGERTASTRFVVTPGGEEILRSVNPVANREACRECHGPAAQNPVNGILYVDYDAAPIRDKASRTTLLLMGSGAVIVLLNLAGGWWFIQRHVLGPVGALAAASMGLAAGDLGRRVTPAGDDELGQLATTFNDMAGQLQERVALVEHQREFLQALLDAIPDGVRVIGPDYRVVLTNRAYRDQLGLGEADGVGEPCHLAAHQSATPCPPTLLTCPVHEIKTRAVPVKALHRHQDRDGNTADVEIYAAPLVTLADGRTQTMVVESIRDLSKQIHYSHEQKLAELGKLATGVAHEIHNPLASIRLALDGLRAGMSEIDPEVREYLELVDQEVDKCVKFTERLLRLGMQPPDAPELVEVESIATDMLALLHWETQQIGVSVRTALLPGLRVLASDSGLRMVLLNLIQNAFHAMPQGGELYLGACRVGTWIEISVRDTGIGIEPERLERIFDPFYSRRADGARGTGLGLSIVRTIVDAWGGRVEVQSEPGNGSVFRVCLPDPAAEEQGAT
jgi:signal transduction histidine kinase